MEKLTNERDQINLRRLKEAEYLQKEIRTPCPCIGNKNFTYKFMNAKKKWSAAQNQKIVIERARKKDNRGPIHRSNPSK